MMRLLLEVPQSASRGRAHTAKILKIECEASLVIITSLHIATFYLWPHMSMQILLLITLRNKHLKKSSKWPDYKAAKEQEGPEPPALRMHDQDVSEVQIIPDWRSNQAFRWFNPLVSGKIFSWLWGWKMGKPADVFSLLSFF